MTIKSSDLRSATDPHQAVAEIDNASGLVSLVSKAELDQRIETAHRYPRSLTKFRREALDMATVDEATAKECVYALPRREFSKESNKYETKIISGPSVRLAEILLSAWGNTRAGTRIVEETKDYIVAQGVFYDLEKNNDITSEVRRRITTKDGNRYSADMIMTTANAAGSIALRNAVTKGIPRALWAGIYDEVRRVIAGDAKTMGTRRDEVLSRLNKMGVSNDRIFGALAIGGISDIGLDEIVTLNGFGNAIKDAEVTIDEVFPPVILTDKTRQSKQPEPTGQQPNGNAEPQKKADEKKVDEQPERQQGAQPKQSDEQTEAQRAAWRAEKEEQIAAQSAQREAIAKVQTELTKESQEKGELNNAAPAGFDDEQQPNMMDKAEQKAAAEGRPTFIELTQAISKAESAQYIIDSVVPMIDEIPNERHRKTLLDMANSKAAALSEEAAMPPAEKQQQTKATPPASGRARRNVEMD